MMTYWVVFFQIWAKTFVCDKFGYQLSTNNFFHFGTYLHNKRNRCRCLLTIVQFNNIFMLQCGQLFQYFNLLRQQSLRFGDILFCNTFYRYYFIRWLKWKYKMIIFKLISCYTSMSTPHFKALSEYFCFWIHEMMKFKIVLTSRNNRNKKKMIIMKSGAYRWMVLSLNFP